MSTGLTPEQQLAIARTRPIAANHAARRAQKLARRRRERQLRRELRRVDAEIANAEALLPAPPTGLLDRIKSYLRS